MTIAQVLAGEKRWHILTGKWQDVLTLPDRSVDHVITDPPYQEHVHANLMSCTTSKNRAFEARKVACDFAALTDFDHVAAGLKWARRWSMFFCATEHFGDYKAANPELHVRSGIYHKLHACPQLSGDRPAHSCEGVSIFHAPGRKRWNGGGTHAFWEAIPELRKDTGHPTAKPLSLMLELVSLFTDLDDLVLDPYCGSGTTGVACLRLGRRFIGCEMNAEWAQLARDRMTAEEQQSTLSAARAGQLPMFGR